MCGIAGLFSLDGRPIDCRALLKMTQRLRHRGPDDGGLVLLGSDGVKPLLGEIEMQKVDSYLSCFGGLGHRRLSIIDLSTGNQPMKDASGRYWLVYNGEIYNYRALRQELEALGTRFYTTSDTEVLLAGLVRWGTKALDRLEGMFAFALWDCRLRHLLLARDRFGIKPLYYTTHNGLVAFGSEIKALLALPQVDRQINKTALRDYLTHRYISSPHTAFQGIQCLPPAHFLSIDLSKSTISEPKCWRQIDTQVERQVSMSQAMEELDALLSTVCSDHIVSDVPVGIFLSGGIDSSAILAHVQAGSTGPLQAISVGFGGMALTNFNELDAARKIAAHLGARLETIELDFNLLEALPETVAALDEPMSDPSALPVFMMMKAARSHGKVMLSGDGGDEVFGGYNRYRKILRESTRPMAKIGDFLAGFIGNMENRMMRRYLDEISITSVSEVEKLLLPDFLPQDTYIPLDRRVMHSETRDPLTQWQELDLQTYLVDDNLKKTDRMSMWHNLEVRVPFVDRRIVEFGLSLPHRLRLHKKSGKHILRRCLRERLPQKILSRKKVGFKVPLRRWLRGGEAASLLQSFSDPHKPIWQVVHREVGMSWLQDHSTGKRNCEAQLWNLIVLNEWLTQYA